MIRAEIVCKNAGLVRDIRIDRGKITAVGPGRALTILERDGTSVSMPVASTARIKPWGRACGVQRAEEEHARADAARGRRSCGHCRCNSAANLSRNETGFAEAWGRTGGVVLLVEDEHSIGALIRSYLQKDGYRVVWVRSGEEALVELARHAVRIVVLDIGLPGMDGFEVCRKMRRTPLRFRS